MEKKKCQVFNKAIALIVIPLLIIFYVAAGIYFHFVLGKGTVYPHIAYIPIVLAGIWYGRKAVYVAAILAGAVMLFHVFGDSPVPMWSDLARIIFFMVVALCTGTLSEKVQSGREALCLSEDKFRFLVDKSLAGIILYQKDKIAFANPQFAAMLGYEPDEMINKVIWGLIFEEDRSRVKEMVSSRWEEGFDDLHYETRLVRKDGKIIWAEVASSVEHYDGESAVLVNIYDITERKEAEDNRLELLELTRSQEEQLVHSSRLAELGEMAAAIAHELNQPLTGIRNFARNAAYMIDKEAGGITDVRENLELISKQVDRASRVINRMRELVRKSDQKLEIVDINTIVTETVEFLMPQFKLQGIAVNIDTDMNLPRVMGDRTRLEQVFLNILTNARQAMEESPVQKLNIKTFYNKKAGRPVGIEISDTGSGFSINDVDKLFLPFYTTKEPGSGTGLGLSISLNILKEHEGTIEAVGDIGKGARFTVRLPVAEETGLSEGSTSNER